MSWALNNVTTLDNYDPTTTLDGLPFPRRFNIDVFNAAVFWSLRQVSGKAPTYTGGTWGQEVFMAPGSRSLYRAGAVGIRVRSALAMTPAQVTIEAVE